MTTQPEAKSEPVLPARNAMRSNGATKCDLTPLLLTARQAASLCAVSLRTWRTRDSGGLIPRPVRINRSTLWRADELRAWVSAGCPRREEWEARK